MLPKFYLLFIFFQKEGSKVKIEIQHDYNKV